MVYYWGSKVVSIVGLEQAIVIVFGAMLLGIYLLWIRLRHPPGPVWRLGVFVPFFMSLLLSLAGWTEGQETIALLQQTNSLSPPQTDLLHSEIVGGTISTIGIGVLVSGILWWLVFWYGLKPTKVGQNAPVPRSAGAREEKNAEPV